MVQERRIEVCAFRYDHLQFSLRYTILYCGNLISNAFGSLIAAGVLANMKGVLGHAAWRWLFYSKFSLSSRDLPLMSVEGAITMFVAVIAIPILPDFPHNTRGFSEEERQLAQLRMLEDVSDQERLCH